MNTSTNDVDLFSGIRLYAVEKSSISFSTFLKNKATKSDGYSCIFCELRDHLFATTNIIENEQETEISDSGIIHASYSTISMVQCNILYNKPGKGKVFYQYSGTISCDNCSIGIDQEGSVTTKNPAASLQFIDPNEFLQLESCYSNAINKVTTNQFFNLKGCIKLFKTIQQILLFSVN